MQGGVEWGALQGRLPDPLYLGGGGSGIDVEFEGEGLQGRLALLAYHAEKGQGIVQLTLRNGLDLRQGRALGGLLSEKSR